MNEDRLSRLAEWYGAGGRASVGPDGGSGGPGPISTPTPPCPPSDSAPRRKRRSGHAGARAAGLCALLVVIIAATALLFSGDSRQSAAEGGPGSYGDYRDYFAEYYDVGAEESRPAPEIRRAETGLGVAVPTAARAQEGGYDLSGLYEACSRSVAALTCSDGSGRYSWGSGVIMTEDGYIVTNAHILAGMADCTVTLWDDREYPAALVGSDNASDVAIIKIDCSGLPAAAFCADEVRVGEAVAAIGNPLGPELRGTLTNGIVSGLSREMSYTGHPMDLIQTNVAINEGSSGGALFNMYGQVVGITSMKLVSTYAASNIEGIGFAIPVETIKSVGDSLLENGRVTGHPARGITVGEMPGEAAEDFAITKRLYVTAVAEGSDAEAKGVQVGDILVSADGRHVSETEELSAVIDAKSAGDAVSLELYRYGGDMVYADVTLMESSDIY